MKYCDKCKVNIRGQSERCPLCGGNISGEDDSMLYPDIPSVYKQFELLFKLLIVGSISAGIISVAVNLIFPEHGFWSLFAILGLICFWIILSAAIRKRHNMPYVITMQAVLISGLCVLWDYITAWHGWSLDFVIPIAFSTAMIAIGVLVIVLKMPVSDYIVAMLTDAFFGIITLIFYFTGILNTSIPTLICISISLISFTALIVFEGKNMLTELSKRFHL